MAYMATAQLEAFLSQLEAKDIQTHFQQEALFYNSVAKDASAEFVNGKGWKLNAYLVPDASNAWFAEGGAFPAGGQMTFQNMYVNAVRYAKSSQLSGDYLEDLERSEGTRIDFAKHVGFLNASGIRELEEQCVNGDGTGAKAVAKASGSSGTTVAFRTATTGNPLDTKGAMELIPNGIYDQYSSAGALTAANITLTSVNYGAATAVANTSLTITNDDVFVYAGSYNKAYRGLPYLINNDSGVFQMLSRSTYPQLKCVVDDVAGAALTISTISKHKRKLKYRSGQEGGKGLMILAPEAQCDLYERLGYNLRRYAASDKKFNPTFDELGHGDSTIMSSVVVSEDRLYTINRGDIGRLERKPWGFYDRDGLKIRQASGTFGAGSDGWFFSLGIKGNLFIKTPRLHGLIKRLSLSDAATEVGAWA